jgi:hypothetical protein
MHEHTLSPVSSLAKVERSKVVAGWPRKIEIGKIEIGLAACVLIYGIAVAAPPETAPAATSADVSPSYASSPGADAEHPWWAPGGSEVMPKYSTYKNPEGALAILNADGPVDTKNHPFFRPSSSNGRACVTCHQPSSGMSISASKVQERWEATNGSDPLFAAFDGSNCPNLPQADKKSHSLLLSRGLFRIPMPWPPRDSAGKPIKPEFSIEVISDPTGCNTGKKYGLESSQPTISVYRRPRMVANLKYVEPEKPLGLWQVRTGELLPLDDETGHRLAGNLMSDGRSPTLRAQMLDAMSGHLEAHEVPSKADRETIHRFETQIYAAQVYSNEGGSLQEGGAHLGPTALLEGKTGVLGAFPYKSTFPEIDGWRTQRTSAAMTWAPVMQPPTPPAAREGEANESPSQREYRDSVARGFDLFLYRQFLIRNVGSLNPLLGNPVKQSCAVCHNMQETGEDNAPGYLGLGTNTYPYATPAPDLPLFKLTCHLDAPPHPYLGRVIYTSDPGRALVTGKCADIGAATAQQMRALAARAPYFSGGSAKTLREVIEFYDRRFNIGYTERDIQDLVNFLGAL